MESQTWLANDYTPTDADLADPSKNQMKVDWVRVYKPVAGSSVNILKKNSEKNLEVFPNPSFKEDINVKINGLINESALKVIDISGRELYRDSILLNETVIPSGVFPGEGTYYIHVKTDQATEVQKIIVI